MRKLFAMALIAVGMIAYAPEAAVTARVADRYEDYCVADVACDAQAYVIAQYARMRTDWE